MPGPKSRASRARGSDEEFVLFLQGIPAHCRWQELKDLVRQTALHIRQAVVYDDHHGFPTGLGQIIVKNEDEAWRTYHRLSTNGWEGQSLVVTLARTSSPTCPIAGPTKSPPCVMAAAGYSTPPPRGTPTMAVPPSPISPDAAPEYGPGPLMSPLGIPPQAFLPVFPEPMSPALSTTTAALTPGFALCPPYPLPMHPPAGPNPRRRNNQNNHNKPFAYPSFFPLPYTHPPPTGLNHAHTHSITGPGLRPTAATATIPGPGTGLTTTATSATRPTHRRTLFIQNLSPSTTPKALRSLFTDAGTVEQCEIPTDPDTGRCKGFARVTFRTGDEAKRAVALFNNSVFLGSKMRVKIDRSIQVACTPLPHSLPLSVPLPMSVSLAQAAGGMVYHPFQYHHPPPQQPPPPHSHSYSLSRSQSQVSTSAGAGAGAGAGMASGGKDALPVAGGNVGVDTPPLSGASSVTSSEVGDVPLKKPVDRCGPLVVNGSGVGSRAVAT